MSDTNVGRLLFDKGQRDAIHVAIAPVTAIEPLEPGQHIGLTGNQDHVCSNARVLIGVVDPFLKRTVYMKVPTEHSMTLTNKDALTLLAQLREEQ